jgi:hypothetical protein
MLSSGRRAGTLKGFAGPSDEPGRKLANAGRRPNCRQDPSGPCLSSHEIRIHPGDSITWTLPTNELHSVTLLTPGGKRKVRLATLANSILSRDRRWIRDLLLESAQTQLCAELLGDLLCRCAFIGCRNVVGGNHIAEESALHVEVTVKTGLSVN